MLFSTWPIDLPLILPGRWKVRGGEIDWLIINRLGRCTWCGCRRRALAGKVMVQLGSPNYFLESSCAVLLLNYYYFFTLSLFVVVGTVYRCFIFTRFLLFCFIFYCLSLFYFYVSCSVFIVICNFVYTYSSFLLVFVVLYLLTVWINLAILSPLCILHRYFVYFCLLSFSVYISLFTFCHHLLSQSDIYIISISLWFSSFPFLFPCAIYFKLMCYYHVNIIQNQKKKKKNENNKIVYPCLLTRIHATTISIFSLLCISIKYYSVNALWKRVQPKSIIFVSNQLNHIPNAI